MAKNDIRMDFEIHSLISNKEFVLFSFFSSAAFRGVGEEAEFILNRKNDSFSISFKKFLVLFLH